jgi:hypothetical protein
VASERGDRPQRQVSVERTAGLVEEIVEHAAHCEHGRAGIEPRLADGHFAHLAARDGGALEHDHPQAAARQQRRRRQPANAGADDGHAWARHGFLTPEPAGASLRSAAVHFA